MAGNTFKWQGGNNNNDAATLANWLVEQSGSYVAAAVLPGTLDTITFDNGGVINDSSGDLSVSGSLTAVSFTFAGLGGTLELGNTTLDRNNSIGSMNVVAGTTGTVITTGSVTDRWNTSISGAGATLDVQVGAGTLDLQNPLFALAGGSATIAASAGGTLAMDGGVIVYGGTVDVAAPAVGNGLFVVGGGGVMTLQSVASRGESIAFIDGTGTLVLQQTGTVGGAMLGFQAGDTIDLTALNDATLQPIIVNGNLTTLTDGTNTVVLPLLDEGFTSGSFLATADPGGHVLLTTTLANADWLNGATGDWSTGTAWSTGVAPTGTSNVVIGDLNHTFAVTATNESAHALLMLAPNGTLAVSGTFNVATAIFDTVGTFAVQSGATVTAKVFNQLINGGTLTMASAAQMTLTGGSTIAGAGALAANLAGDATLNGGTLDASAGSVLIGLASDGDTVEATGGAHVTANYTGIGGFGTASGSLTLNSASWTDSGTASTADPFGGDMVVGGAQRGASGGNGTLMLQNYASLGDQNAIIAANTAAQGTVDIQDNASWSIANNLTVGGGAGSNAQLMLSAGTTATGGILNVGGTVQVNGGTMQVLGGSHATAASFAMNGGSLNVDSSSAFIVGIGTSFGGNGLVIDAGATATLSGGDIGGAITDNGVLLVSGASASTIDASTISGSGTIVLDSTAPLIINTGAAWTTTIAFATGSQDLVLSAPSADLGTIDIAPAAGSGQTNTIDMPGITFAMAPTITYDSTTGVLNVNGGSAASLQVGAGLQSNQFQLQPDHGTGSAIVVSAAPCYAAGTRLATPDGEVAVERLQPGDAVLALQDGAWVARRVRWVGRTTVDLARHPQPERAAPIRIRAHAIAPDMPARDLVLSPEHAVFLDGVLMQAQALLNGASVTQEFPARVTYLHVELDRHALLRAEGMPAESYLDTGNRALFAGAHGVRALHPDFATAAAWTEQACAPLVLDGPRLAAAHARLRDRAEALGFALTERPDLCVLADRAKLVPDDDGAVLLPAGTTAVRLVSRSFVPAWLGLGDDRRRLGIAVAAVEFGGAALPEDAFGPGWHAPEPGWRWTDGDAHLALAPLPCPTTLRVTPAAFGARYWTAPLLEAATRAA